MILLIILAMFWVLCIAFFAWIDECDRFGGAGLGFILGFCASAVVIVIAMGLGSAFQHPTHLTTHRHTLVTLNDGSSTHGSLYGSVFVVMGQVDQQQEFRYYLKDGDGSFRLERRAADKSKIFPDATQKTAHVDITDKVTTCKPAWWYLCGPTPDVEFVHADFHVPVGSIVNDFKLDAQ